jgi:predicted alpha/beta-hydrolase family hydrolase
MEIVTALGPARVTIDLPGQAGGSGAAGPLFLLVLTHGANVDVDTPDLLSVRDAGLRLGGAVARVTQPYRVRGARAPGPADPQDAAWIEVIAALRGQFDGIPLVQGGRSNGARVVCRTARSAGARAVVALAFPLHPQAHPERSREAELLSAGTEVLVVNGDRDPFGIPREAQGIRITVLAGESHALSGKPAAVGDAVASWLRSVLNLSLSPE